MKLRKKQNGITILIYFALKPLYISDSGAAQIADLLIIAFVFFDILKNNGKMNVGKNANITRFFFALVLYQFILNLIWSGITDDMTMNYKTLYYIFNMIVFSHCLCIGNRIGSSELKKAIGKGSFLAIIIATIGILFYDSGRQRVTGFFENPNQLGYFALIMLTVVVICHREMPKYMIVSIVVFSIWASIISMSKATIISIFGYSTLLVLFNRKKATLKKLIIQVTLIVFVFSSIYVFLFSDLSFITSNKTILVARNRVINLMNENDSDLGEGRGYSRVLEVGENILWGTGEGAYERFVTKNGKEVHSTFVSLLTCYGLIGLSGYLYIFKKAIGKGAVMKQNIINLSGLILYSITHNGIRNTLLWCILALILV